MCNSIKKKFKLGEESCKHSHRQKDQVLLISMPFGSLLQPSIGLSLLKAGLTSHNIHSKILYFTFKFGELIGTPLYLQIANGQPAIYDLLGEWLFSGALFNFTDTDVEGYIEDVLRGRSPAHSEAHRDMLKPVSESFIQEVLDIRSKIEAFLDECLQEIIGYHPRIVAFTSVFQQQLAALSLAKRLKVQAPETFIILGGANCEGVMGAEVIRQFSFIDATISGEGDIVFPKLIQRLLEQKSVSDLQGVFTHDNIEQISLKGQYLNAPSVSDMNALPFPDYDDFFQQLEISHLPLEENHQPELLFETSRGCWWGERNHCTFCGLNGITMSYRSKSARRALDELVYLTDKYPNCSVSVVDNILDMKYFKDFVPELTSRQLDLELFYEVKANLKKEQVRLLRDAGIRAIQPGIESLSTHVLDLMRKGVKGLQNIQLLKWCKELGVNPSWNMLWGFPGEPPEEYERMADLIPLLTHLQPPLSAATIRLDRFSPHFDRPEQFGFVKVNPYPSYHYIYPLNPETIANLAYYFTFEYRKPQDVASYTKPVAEQIAAWQEAYETSTLFSVDLDTHLLICDLRPIAHKPLEILTDLQKNLYIACDRIQTARQLQQLIEEHYGKELLVQEIEDLLQPLIKSGLLIKEDSSYLSLAIPLGDYSPKNSELEQFQKIVRAIGNLSGERVAIPRQSLC
jgi:ribosomal peptide maturation radical SAM protein 1